ncbi:MAG: MFS transporter [Parasporobacterium sp.]|nr:MFS transporter [Parasporobacterium sp.]
MTQKKSINFGFRGWILILFQAAGFYTYCIFNSFAQNIQAGGNAEFFGWNPNMVSTVYTITVLLTIVFQFAAAGKVATAKSVKKLALIFEIISLIFGVLMATVFVSEVLWLIFFACAIFFSLVGATLIMGILVGQWFPRRKGTVMGIATFAFPITNAFLSLFATKYFMYNGMGMRMGTLLAYAPYLIVSVIVLILGAVFLKDYPEQAGCYRDNDRSLTPDAARAIMEAEIAAKKNSVWKLGNTLKMGDFWLLVIPQGLLLASSVGAMCQIINILNLYPEVYEKYGNIQMLGVCVVACFGSWLLGVIDTKFGTKKAIIISSVLMIISGVLGFIQSLPTLMISLALLCVFEGAASNFGVSSAAQYWRREDFATVWGWENPAINVIQAFGPMLVAIVGAKAGFPVVFGIFAILGIISLVLIILFKPARIAARDAKYRAEAGLNAEGVTKSNAELMGEK